MLEILDSLIEELRQMRTVIIAAIVRSRGSAPRTSGARMLVRKDESIVGTIGGGALEGYCLQKAHELFSDSADYLEIDYSMDSSDAADQGMICGGFVSVLLQKITPDMLETFISLQADYAKGNQTMLLTTLPQDGLSPQLMSCGAVTKTALAQEIVAKLDKKNCRVPFLLQTEKSEIFVEPLVSPGVVYVVGAGHVGHATAQLARFTGFEVVVIDDRDEFANSERFKNVREVKVIESFIDCFGNLSGDDYVVIVTRGHLHDREVLAQALKTKAGYIGMIGSRKKRDFIYQSLITGGYDQSDLGRINSPIGLDIGADTPNEIALSIVAELVKARADK